MSVVTLMICRLTDGKFVGGLCGSLHSMHLGELNRWAARQSCPVIEQKIASAELLEDSCNALNNVVASFVQLQQLLSGGGYSPDELLLAACPSPEQVSVLLSSASLLGTNQGPNSTATLVEEEVAASPSPSLPTRGAEAVS